MTSRRSAKQIDELASVKRAIVALEAQRATLGNEVTNTALAAHLDAEIVRDLINSVFDRLAPIVKKYDGTIEKFNISTGLGLVIHLLNA
jgi:hypothetical protein